MPGDCRGRCPGNRRSRKSGCRCFGGGLPAGAVRCPRSSMVRYGRYSVRRPRHRVRQWRRSDRLGYRVCNCRRDLCRPRRARGESGQNFSQQEPGAELRRDEIGMFADPPGSSLLGPGFFHDRPRVDIGAMTVARAKVLSCVVSCFRRSRECRGSPDPRHTGRYVPLPGRSSRAHWYSSSSRGNDRAAAWQHHARVRPFGRVARHPGHGGVEAALQPFM